MGGGSKIRVALVDEDGSPRSTAFLGRLEAARELETQRTSRADGEDAVRKGRRTAFVIVPKGFGVAAERLFYGAPPSVELGVDPSRRAESGMLEGVLMKYGVQEMQTAFSDPTVGRRAVENARQSLSAGRDTARDPDAASTAAFLTELDKYLQRPRSAASPGTDQGFGAAGWTPLAIARRDVAADDRGPRSSFEFTFPQGVVWGLIGCIMSFAVGLVVERTHGTLVRLQTAPLTRAADVMLKERRRLVLVPRETPMSLPELRNMVACAEAGAMILPAMPAFYQQPKTIDDLADFLAGKILNALGFDQQLFPPWKGDTPSPAR